jgi:hypothetical protein
MRKGSTVSPEIRAKISEKLKLLHKQGKAGGFKKSHPLFSTSIAEWIRANPGKHPSLGKSPSEETRRKISASNKGRKVWNTGKTGYTVNVGENPYFPKGHTKTPKGAAHWNWKGGVRSLRKYVQELSVYREWRTSIFQRDRFTCVRCGQIGGRLEADHIKPYSVIIDQFQIKTVDEAKACAELWDTSNGRTLCQPCHRSLDTSGIKFARKKNFNLNTR